MSFATLKTGIDGLDGLEAAATVASAASPSATRRLLVLCSAILFYLHLCSEWLQELSLHQLKVRRIENLDRICRNIKILYLQVQSFTRALPGPKAGRTYFCSA